MEEKLSCNVSVHEEELEGKKVFVVECAELGVSDFGYTKEKVLNNFKKAVSLLLQEKLNENRPINIEVIVKSLDVESRDLNREFEAWERAGVEDLENFEKQI